MKKSYRRDEVVGSAQFPLLKRVLIKTIELDIAFRQLAYDCAEVESIKKEEAERIEKLRKAIVNVENIRNVETVLEIMTMQKGEAFFNLNKWVHLMAMPCADEAMPEFDKRFDNQA